MVSRPPTRSSYLVEQRISKCQPYHAKDNGFYRNDTEGGLVRYREESRTSGEGWTAARRRWMRWPSWSSRCGRSRSRHGSAATPTTPPRSPLSARGRPASSWSTMARPPLVEAMVGVLLIKTRLVQWLPALRLCDLERQLGCTRTQQALPTRSFYPKDLSIRRPSDRGSGQDSRQLRPKAGA
jgi:hypothetical protein